MSGPRRDAERPAHPARSAWSARAGASTPWRWRSGRTAEVVVTPGNPGIAGGHAPRATPITSVADAPPEEIDADLFVIGPEAPLVDGLADRLRADGPAGVRARGRRGPARGVQGLHEGGAGRGRRAHRPLRRLRRRRRRPRRSCARCPGRGWSRPTGWPPARACWSPTRSAEAEADIEAKLSGEAFGDAGRRVVVEEGLVGPECSLLVLCDGDAAGAAGPGPGLQAARRRRRRAQHRRHGRVLAGALRGRRPGRPAGRRGGGAAGGARCGAGASTTGACSTPGSC